MAFVPSTPREARVWNFLNRELDWFPLRSWPVWLVRLAMKEHKSNRDRFSLFFFWTANGMDPERAAAHLLMTDVQGGRYTQTYGYDQQAFRQVQQMVTQVYDGTLFPNGKRYWNMAMQRVMLIGSGEEIS